MQTVAATQVKARFPEMLQAAAGGECIVITQSGRPVAQLVPVDAPAECNPPDPLEREIKRLQKLHMQNGNTEAVAEILAMRDAGRR